MKKITVPVLVGVREGDAPIFPMNVEEPSAEVLHAIDRGLRVGFDANGYWVRNWASYEDDFATLHDAAVAYLESLDWEPREFDVAIKVRLSESNRTIMRNATDLGRRAGHGDDWSPSTLNEAIIEIITFGDAPAEHGVEILDY